MRKTPSVVLVGRPNVGKSTLFNRITGSRRAIVAPVAGTTRDALGKEVMWRGRLLELFDTGHEKRVTRKAGCGNAGCDLVGG